MTGPAADCRGCGKLPEERAFRQRNFRNEAIPGGLLVWQTAKDGQSSSGLSTDSILVVPSDNH